MAITSQSLNGNCVNKIEANHTGLCAEKKKFEDSLDLRKTSKLDTCETDPDTLCGLGGFKPSCIQSWATPKTYLILYSIIGVVEGIFYTYRIGVITTLEKRFAFKSSTSGMIIMVDEISPIFFGAFIGYIGGKTHRPRMFGLGMMFNALCSFLYALPFFMYGPASHLTAVSIKSETYFEMCLAREDGHCEPDNLPPTLTAVYLFVLGGLLKGFGNVAYCSIGLSYLDDNAKKKNFAMYFATSHSMRLVGPMIGYLLASLFLKYPENPLSVPQFAREDPRWIGSWWIGFAFQAVMLALFALPLFLFPRRLPGQKKQVQVTKTSWKDLWAAIKRLMVNPVYMAAAAINCLQVFGSVGHSIMLPKYMEQQFRLTASDASLYSGPAGVAVVMVATVIGGYFVFKFRPRVKSLIGIMFMMEVTSAIGYLLLMIPKCEKLNMQNYGMNSNGLILDGPCNSNCNCSTRTFSPMCGSDSQSVLFSPCYAGCTEFSNSSFLNCSCAVNAAGISGGHVTEGFCLLEGCWVQALAYIITYPILQFFVFIFRVQYTVLLIRCVKTEDKSIALGFLETLNCIFGFVPFLVMFGSLVDTACLVWEETCGEAGNCWFYDTDHLNWLMHVVSAGFTFLTALSLYVPFCLSDRLGDLYTEDEEGTETTVKAGTEEVSANVTTQFLS